MESAVGFVLFVAAPNTSMKRAATRHLDAHFPDTSAQVWRSTRTWQSRLAPSRPRHSLGVNIMIRYMEWGCALYRAVQEHGMSQAEAAGLVETVLSDNYRPVPTTLFRISRIRSAKHETRVKWLLANQIRYFFTSPFRHRHLEAETGVAFDVVLCPLADYFEGQGVPELTPHAACNLDYLMAREYEVDLVRSRTIADGAAECDFRWQFPAAGSS